MATFHLWPFWLGMLITLGTCAANPKNHYHRYMLSDYRPQHSRKLQLDYKPVRRPVYPTEANENKSGEVASGQVHDMLVGIYYRSKYLCVGTLLNDQTMIAAASCLRDYRHQNLTIRTQSNKQIGLHMVNSDVYPILDGESVVTLLALTKPVPQANHMLRLCETQLRINTKVEVPRYRITKGVVVNREATVLPLEECRRQLNDTVGNVVTPMTICIKNENQKSRCKNTFGNPLIYNGQLCGINILGVNCPKKLPVTLYASVSNEELIKTRSLATILKNNLDDSML